MLFLSLGDGLHLLCRKYRLFGSNAGLFDSQSHTLGRKELPVRSISCTVGGFNNLCGGALSRVVRSSMEPHRYPLLTFFVHCLSLFLCVRVLDFLQQELPLFEEEDEDFEIGAAGHGAGCVLSYVFVSFVPALWSQSDCALSHSWYSLPVPTLM